MFGVSNFKYAKVGFDKEVRTLYGLVLTNNKSSEAFLIKKIGTQKYIETGNSFKENGLDFEYYKYHFTMIDAKDCIELHLQKGGLRK